ncbi:hypothetical protein [Streptomyces kaempferi]|uniref:Uncharacterized protein n=1 Tax=Streptomyces kaempferi TaxID=333725 RepID=A0ABW3XIJ6_9ACTN
MSGKTEARDLLLSLIDATKASDLHDTTPEQAVANAIHEALIYQPSLRNCIFPTCIREFDMTARMNGWEPVNPSWSGDGWHQAIRGISHGSICPDHVAVITDHMARPAELPNGRWTLSCACGWMPRPQTWGGLLKPLWEQHILTAAGVLPAPETPAEPFERIPLAEHTESTLTELYDQLDDTEHDRQETREAAQAMYRGWDWHRNTLGGISRAVVAVCNMMRTSADFLDHRDWTADRIDAYLWAVLIGWNDDTLAQLAEKHRWNEHRIKYIREMRALLAPITDPQPKED